MKDNSVNRPSHRLWLLTGLLLAAALLRGEASAADRGGAEWIGCTHDDRPAEWAARDVIFNRPPADISTWKPTPKELESKSRASYPAPLLRKTFAIEKPIQSARISVSGLGLYELHLNGRKAGDRVLDPAQTTYDKRTFFVIHDVTILLQQGSNATGLMLGSGFYGQNVAFGGRLAAADEVKGAFK